MSSGNPPRPNFECIATEFLSYLVTRQQFPSSAKLLDKLFAVSNKGHLSDSHVVEQEFQASKQKEYKGLPKTAGRTALQHKKHLIQKVH